MLTGGLEAPSSELRFICLFKMAGWVCGCGLPGVGVVDGERDWLLSLSISFFEVSGE